MGADEAGSSWTPLAAGPVGASTILRIEPARKALPRGSSASLGRRARGVARGADRRARATIAEDGRAERPTTARLRRRRSAGHGCD